MDDAQQAGYRRVTLAAATIRIDLALPAGLPLIGLMTDLLELTGSRATSDPTDHRDWQLSRTGGVPLDLMLSLGDQRVRDGDIVFLDRRSVAPEPPVYDDTAEAIGAAAGAGRPWTDAARATGRMLGGALILLAGNALWQMPTAGRAGPLGIGAATVLLLLAGLLRRVGADPWTVVLLAAAAMLSAAIGGLRFDPADRQPDMLIGCASLLVASIVALLVITAMSGRSSSGNGESAASRAGVALSAGAGVIGLAGVLVFAVAGDTGAPVMSAAAGALVLGWIGLRISPRMALRLALITVAPPRTHPGAEHRDPAADLARLRQRSDSVQVRAGVALGFLIGLTSGATVITGCSAVVLVTTTNRWGWLLAGVGLAVVMLQARGVSRNGPLLAMLAPTLIAGICCLLVLERHLTVAEWVPATARPALWLALAAVAIGFGLLVPRLRPPPGIRRIRTMIEAVLTAALVPLALATMDLYQVIRHL